MGVTGVPAIKQPAKVVFTSHVPVLFGIAGMILEMMS